MMRWSSRVLAICVLWIGAVKALEKCEPDQSRANPYCVCYFNNGSVIDLRSISSKDGPKFDKIKGVGATSYSYDPCYPFNISSGCVNATICKQVDRSVTTLIKYNLDYVSFQPEGGNQLYINYANGRTYIKIKLRCDNTSSAPNVIVDSGNIYENDRQNFILTSKCSCADGCKEEPQDRHHKSKSDPGYIGIGVLSGLVVIVILYFIIGSLIMRCHYQATGSDIIPNKTFWIILPFLVKDGVVFTCSPCVHYYRRQEYKSLDKVMKQEQY